MYGGNFKVENIGSIYYSHNQTDYVSQHEHKFVEIVYYLEGKGLTTVYGANADNFKYSTDSFLVIPPNVRHDEYSATETSIVCNQIVVPSINIDSAIFLKKTTKNQESMERVKNLMLLLHEKYVKFKEDKSEENRAEADAVSTRLSIAVFKLLSEEKKNKSYVVELVGLIKDYIKKIYLQKIDFCILAEDFGYSYDRLRHLFLEQTGMTLFAYQQNLKMNYVKEQLVFSNLKIKEIAKKCGFNSNVRFTIWFNSLVGISPKTYRDINASFKWGVVLNFERLKKISGKNMIVDTDLGCDCDDAAAIAILSAFHKNRQVNILCMTHSIDDEQGVRCIDYINRYYGNDFDLGIAKSSKIDKQKYMPRFVYKLADEYDKTKEIHDALTLTKQKLKSVEDRSVSMVYIGQLNNLAELIKDCEGYQLLRQKVEKIVIMAGNFSQQGEYFTHKNMNFKAEFNIEMDIESAKTVVEKLELPLYFVDFNQGANVITGSCLIKHENHPVSKIYKLFGVEKRESWDLVAVLYAIFEGGAMFSCSDSGMVSIDDNGRTVFTIGGGNHHILTLNMEKAITEQIENILQGICEM